MCVPAFASSRIGSRSGDVRYDEFSGYSSTMLPGKQSTYTPAFLCGLLGVLWYLLSVMLMLSLSCVLVTYPTHLLPQSKTYYRHSPPITLCLMFVALRVVGMLRAVVYLDLISGYVGRLIHDSSMDNVGEVNNDICCNKN